MKFIHFGWLVPLSALCIVACSSSPNSGAPGDDSSDTHEDSGTSGGNKSDAGARRDAAAPIDSGNTDAGIVSLPPFAFVIGGQTRTLTKMDLRMQTDGTDCLKQISMNATLAPIGDESADPGDPPQLQLTVCVSVLPSSGDAQYGITSGDETLAQLQFEFATSNASHFPIADGPGIHVIQDGTAGTFEMSASGTFDLSTDGTGATPFTLQMQQPVTD